MCITCSCRTSYMVVTDDNLLKTFSIAPTLFFFISCVHFAFDNDVYAETMCCLHRVYILDYVDSTQRLSNKWHITFNKSTVNNGAVQTSLKTGLTGPAKDPFLQWSWKIRKIILFRTSLHLHSLWKNKVPSIHKMFHTLRPRFVSKLSRR